MEWSSIIPWLIIGFLLGWLLEFLIDYFFWNRKCKECEEKAGAEISELRGSISALEDAVSIERNAKVDLQTRLSLINAEESVIGSRLGMLVGAGGLLSSLGTAFTADEDAETEEQIARIQAQFEATTDLEDQLRQLMADLDAERNAKNEFEAHITYLQNQLDAQHGYTLEEGDLAHSSAPGSTAALAAPISHPRSSPMPTGQVDVEHKSLQPDLSRLYQDLEEIRNENLLLAKSENNLQEQFDNALIEITSLRAYIAELNGDPSHHVDLGNQLRAEFDTRIRELNSQLGLERQAKVEVDAHIRKLDTELEAERANKAEYESRISDLDANVHRNTRRLGLFAGTGGLVASLGAALGAEDDSAVEAQLSALQAELGGKDGLERELQAVKDELQTASSRNSELEIRLDELNAQLDAERNTKAEYESKIDGIDSGASLASNRLNKVANIGGLIGGLGTAISAENDDELDVRLGELNAELNAKADLENQLRQLMDELDSERDAKTIVETRAAQLQSELETKAEIQAKLDSLESERSQLEKDLESTRSENALLIRSEKSLQEQFDNALLQLNELRAQLSAQSADLDTIRTDHDIIVRSESDLREKFDNSLLEIQGLRERISELDGEVKTKRESEERLLTELDAAQSTTAEFDARINQLTSQLNFERQGKLEVESRLNDANTNLDRTTNRLGLLAGTGGLMASLGAAFDSDDDEQIQARLTELQSELKGKGKLEERVQSLESQLSSVQSAVTAYEAQIVDLNQELSAKAALESEIKSLQDQLDNTNSTFEVRVAQFQDELDTKVNLEKQLRTELEAAHNARAEFEAHVAELNQALSTKSALESEFEATRTQLSSANADFEARLAQLQEELDAKTAAEAQLREGLDAAQRAHSELDVNLSELTSQVDLERQSKIEYESRISDLDTNLNRTANRLNLFAGTGGLVARLGAAFESDDDNEVQARLTELQAELKTKDDLENELQRVQVELSQLQQDLEKIQSEKALLNQSEINLQAELENTNGQLNDLRGQLSTQSSELNRLQSTNAELGGQIGELNHQLGLERQSKAEYQSRLSDLDSNLNRTTNRLGLLAGTGGLVASLGAAFESDDDGEVQARLAELQSELDAKNTLENQLQALQAELDASRNNRTELDAQIGELNRQLELERQSKAEYESHLGELDSNLNRTANRLGLLARTGGLVASLGAAFESDDDSEVQARLAELQSELDAKNALENQLQALQAELDASRNNRTELDAQIGELNRQLELERQSKAEYESHLGELDSNLNRTTNRLGLLARTGGLVASLGAAFESDDDSEVQARLAELQSELDAKSDLENQLRNLNAELEAAQSATAEYDAQIIDLNQKLSAKASLESELETMRTQLNQTNADFDNRIAQLQSDLDAKTNLENQLRIDLEAAQSAKTDLDARISELTNQLDLEHQSKLEYEVRLGEADSSANLTNNRLRKMADAGGLIGSLGAAVNSDNDDELEVRLGELNAELSAKADLEGQLRTLMDELEGERDARTSSDAHVGQLQSELEAKVQVESERDSVQVELGQLQQDLEKIRSENALLNQSEINLQAELESAEGQLNDLRVQLSSQSTELNTLNSTNIELDARIGELNHQLELERQGKIEYESRLGDLGSNLNRTTSRLGLLAGTGGLVASLGAAFDADDDSEVQARLVELQTELDAKNALENQLQELQAAFHSAQGVNTELDNRIGELTILLDAERQSKLEYEARLGEIDSGANLTNSRLQKVANVGGPIGRLGAAVNSDNDGELEVQLGELNAELSAKSDLEEQLRTLMDELESERDARTSSDARVGQLQSELEAKVQAESERDLVQVELSQLQQDLEKIRSENALLNRSEINLQAELESTESQLNDFRVQLSSQSTELNTLHSTNAELDARIGELNHQLELERQSKAEYESRLGDLDSNLNRTTNRLGLLAGTGGLVASLGAAFDADDDSEVQARLVELQTELDAKNALEDQLQALQAELDTSRNNRKELDARIGELNHQLELERQSKAEYESRLGDLDSNLNRTTNRLGLLAGTGGLVASLGAAFDADDDSEVQARLVELQTELDAKSTLENQLQALQAELDTSRNNRKELDARIGELNHQLELERQSQAEYESRLGDLDSNLNRTTNRLGLLAGAGGLVASLGAAFDADDDSEVQARLVELQTELDVKNALENQLGSLKAELEAAQSATAEYEAQIIDLNQKLSVKSDSDLDASSWQIESSTETQDINYQAGSLANMPKFKWVDAKDDLKKINGIGPVMEKRLYEAGIATYEQLADAAPDRLYEIVEAKEWQKVDTPSWIVQARQMKSSGKIMVLEDTTIVGREGDELRQSLNDAVAEVARLRAELSAKPKAPRQAPSRKMKNQLEAAQQEINRLRSGARRIGRDHLQAIEGISAETEGRFYAADITSYLELSEHGSHELTEVSQVDPEVNTVLWIRQANEILAGQRRGYNRLQDIEGIGATYQQRLFDAGFYTYYDVANATIDELRQAIEVEGESTKVDLTNWIHQAYDIVGGTFITGRGGRLGAGGHAADYAVTTTDQRDRLSDILGVGAVYQRRMYEAEIFTFEQVAATDVERLHEICRIQAWQDVDLEDWKAQASTLAQASK
ncbi:MAG: helix-hairpin-helix domain-containing protein [Chloroflexota bacterium]